MIDNGVGIDEDRLAAGSMDHGIGLRNVSERLRVIYGAGCELRLHSVAGRWHVRAPRDPGPGPADGGPGVT